MEYFGFIRVPGSGPASSSSTSTGATIVAPKNLNLKLDPDLSIVKTEPIDEDEETPSERHQRELQELLERKKKASEELADLEREIYKAEGSFLKETHKYGNVVLGWDGYSSGSRIPALKIIRPSPWVRTCVRKAALEKPRRKKYRIRDSDRIFSNSSITSRAAVEGIRREEERRGGDYGTVPPEMYYKLKEAKMEVLSLSESSSDEGDYDEDLQDTGSNYSDELSNNFSVPSTSRGTSAAVQLQPRFGFGGEGPYGITSIRIKKEPGTETGTGNSGSGGEMPGRIRYKDEYEAELLRKIAILSKGIKVKKKEVQQLQKKKVAVNRGPRGQYYKKKEENSKPLWKMPLPMPMPKPRIFGNGTSFGYGYGGGGGDRIGAGIGRRNYGQTNRTVSATVTSADAVDMYGNRLDLGDAATGQSTGGDMRSSLSTYSRPIGSSTAVTNTISNLGAMNMNYNYGQENSGMPTLRSVDVDIDVNARLLAIPDFDIPKLSPSHTLNYSSGTGTTTTTIIKEEMKDLEEGKETHNIARMFIKQESQQDDYDDFFI